jgi:hypothetical protein
MTDSNDKSDYEELSEIIDLYPDRPTAQDIVPADPSFLRREFTNYTMAALAMAQEILKMPLPAVDDKNYKVVLSLKGHLASAQITAQIRVDENSLKETELSENYLEEIKAAFEKAHLDNVS